MSRNPHNRSKPYHHPRTKHWTIQFSLGADVSGKRQRTTITGRTKAEVIARAAAFENALPATEITPTGHTVASYLEYWYAAKRTSWKLRTQELYRLQIDQHIVPRLGKIRLEELTPVDVQGMMTAIVEKRLFSTANKCRRLLFTALKQAVRWETLPRNPVEAVDPVPERPAKKEPWSPTEVRTFLEASQQHRLFTAFYLLIASGLRRGEVLGLRWRDVRKDGISIEQTVVLVGNQPIFETPKTAGSTRFVALDSGTLQLLREHKARQERERQACGRGWEDHDLVFCTQIGTPLHPRNFYRTLRKLSVKAGLRRISVHSLRHLHATLLIMKGQEGKVISDRLGHSSTAFTLDRYGHIFKEYRHRSALPMDELLDDSESSE